MFLNLEVLLELRTVGVIALQSMQLRIGWLVTCSRACPQQWIAPRHPKFVALHLEFVATVLHCSVRVKRTAMQLQTMVANWQLRRHRRSSASPK